VERSPSAARLPVPTSRFHVRRVGAARTAGAALYLWQDVADGLMHAAEFRPDAFQAALLIGQVKDSSGGLAVLVQGYTELAAAHDEFHFLRETIADWTPIQARLRRSQPGMRVLGWAGIRPDGGARLTDASQFVHRSLFGLPWQLTLLLDGRNQRLSAWGADAQGYLVNIGFNLVSPRQPAGRGASTRETSP
jgi:hypothetical protein